MTTRPPTPYDPIPTRFIIRSRTHRPYTITAFSSHRPTSELEVLQLLFQNRSVRRAVITKTNFLHLWNREGFTLDHLLLTTPISIPRFVTDRMLRQIIETRYYAEYLHDPTA